MRNTGIEVLLKHSPFAWMLMSINPIIVINGVIHRKKWGVNYFELPSGTYDIRIFFPYMGNSECGANNTSINLKKGEIVSIIYNMPPWMFAKGKIKVQYQ